MAESYVIEYEENGERVCVATVLLEENAITIIEALQRAHPDRKYHCRSE